mgnify:CR=1 FL=1
MTNPLVNSYKRLVPGYEAPVNVAWSMRNRSPLDPRPGAGADMGTRIEVRMPDPSCNPYLAFGVDARLRAWTASSSKMDPGEPVDRNVFEMSEREKRRLRIDAAPGQPLGGAATTWRRTTVVTDVLGEHILTHFLEAKRGEWAEYISMVPALGDRAVPGQVLKPHPRLGHPLSSWRGGRGKRRNGGREKSRPFLFLSGRLVRAAGLRHPLSTWRGGRGSGFSGR